MSVLVYTENWDGKFRKSTFELVSYSAETAAKMGLPLVALVIGKVPDDELRKLSEHGADKIIIIPTKFSYLDDRLYSEWIFSVCQSEKAQVVVFSHNYTGKALAPRLAVKLKAGMVSAVNQLPKSYHPFVVTKKVFSGKAVANVEVKSEVKVLSLSINSYMTVSHPKPVQVESFNPATTLEDPGIRLREVKKSEGKVLLTDAEIVVSGGRGMRGAEYWKPLEALAETLGAATACSRPVSDEGWRPLYEHVGQTGKIIAPNLYVACGISGAIQHLAGVSGSKFMVAINKDPEAPIFETANYGIIGDVHKILPELNVAFSKFKSE